jgi:hypothetical protein
MAPEAFNRRRSQQADLWSVAVMLYQMLSGRLPFDGDDWAELYGAILNETPEPLPTAVPEWLRQVVAIALTKEPERRYQNAQEMREALRQFERDRQAEITEREFREAVTIPIVKPPNEVVTAPDVKPPDADERRIDQKKAKPEPPPVATVVETVMERKTPRVTRVVIAASLLIGLTAILIWYIASSTKNNAPGLPARAEVMRYWLGLENAPGNRVLGLDPLPAGERFQLHFSPASSGYLYLIAPGEDRVMTAFVTKRRIEAVADFRFPDGDAWINVGEGARFIVIFSPELLNELTFLN